MSKINYVKSCVKLVKNIKNSSAKNKEFKTKVEPKKESDD